MHSIKSRKNIFVFGAFLGPFRDAQKFCALTNDGIVVNCREVFIAARRKQEASGGLIAVVACTKKIVEDFRACVPNSSTARSPQEMVFKIACCRKPKQLNFHSRRQWKGESIVGKLCSVAFI